MKSMEFIAVTVPGFTAQKRVFGISKSWRPVAKRQQDRMNKFGRLAPGSVNAEMLAARREATTKIG
jgi:hypothetical protein